MQLHFIPIRFSLASACLGLALLLAGAPLAGAQRLPNIVIIYADDLGYGDLSCYNPESAYKTPRLDRMAEEGIRFTDAHSPSTICSPSRYGLFSGQQIYRSTGRGGGAFEGPGGPSYLKPGTLTLGGMLQREGIRTGVFGKWHVGLSWLDERGERLGGGFENSLLIDYEKSHTPRRWPQPRGFDDSFVTPNCPTTDPLYIYIENGMVPIPASQRHKRESLPNPGGKWRWDNDEGWMAPGYEFIKADLLFYEKTREFITEHRKEESRDSPSSRSSLPRSPTLPSSRRPEFNGATDAGRGVISSSSSILSSDACSISLVIWGSMRRRWSSSMPTTGRNRARCLDARGPRPRSRGSWRGMKRDGWEGGHRVPFIARWPGRIPPGQVSDQMTNTTDIFATLASLVGYELPDAAATDSFDMLPAMLGTQDPEKPIRPHLLTQSFRGEFQIRQGQWKYFDHQGSGGNSYAKGPLQKYALTETEPDAPGQLYDLANDPGETKNLFFEEAEKRQQLQALLEKLKKDGRSAPKGRVPIGLENIPLLK